MAALFDLRTDLDGSDECIGIIERGGGFHPADIEPYFSGLGLAAPQVTAVSVNQGASERRGP